MHDRRHASGRGPFPFPVALRSRSRSRLRWHGPRCVLVGERLVALLTAASDSQRALGRGDGPAAAGGHGRPRPYGRRLPDRSRDPAPDPPLTLTVPRPDPDPDRTATRPWALSRWRQRRVDPPRHAIEPSRTSANLPGPVRRKKPSNSSLRVASRGASRGPREVATTNSEALSCSYEGPAFRPGSFAGVREVSRTSGTRS